MGDDEDFFVRVGRMGDRGQRPESFLGQASRLARRTGLGALDTKGSSRRRRSGRGRDAARSRLGRRRVIIKSRIVRHSGKRFRAASLADHARYLRREGVTRDGRSPQMFDRDGEARHEAFAERCEGDRHHFRFIVSPEDGASLSDLRAMTRDLMAQAEKDLGTRLDWVAIDHWNTDNPHVHVLVRGVADDGRDLVIDRDYMGHGFRARAEALVELELGPRTEAEIAASLDREVTAERWTSLDRALIGARDADGNIDLRPDAANANRYQGRLIGRAAHLQRLGLAKEHDGRWRLASDLEGQLRGLSERGDIIKTLHAAAKAEQDPSRWAIQGEDLGEAVVGQVVDRGLHDELSGSAYVVIDGVDGRLHHFRFRDLDAAGDTPIGGLAEVRRFETSAGDRRIALLHRSDLSIEAQINASGATWLDRQLVVRDPQVLAASGFGETVRKALDARLAHLGEAGLLDRRGRPGAGLLSGLRSAELDRVQSNLTAEGRGAAKTGQAGEEVAGVYARRIDLVSGRFAMIDDGMGFQLVPWTKALDEHLEREVKGTLSPGGGVDWAIGRKRGIGL